MLLIIHPAVQLVLDDSDRIRSALQDFAPVLEEISAVCDMSSQQEKLDHNYKQVHKMQRKILEPLQHLQEAVGVTKKTKNFYGLIRVFRKPIFALFLTKLHNPIINSHRAFRELK